MIKGATCLPRNATADQRLQSLALAELANSIRGVWGALGQRRARAAARRLGGAPVSKSAQGRVRERGENGLQAFSPPGEASVAVESDGAAAERQRGGGLRSPDDGGDAS